MLLKFVNFRPVLAFLYSFGVLTLASQNSYAQTGFSRACRFSDVSSVLQQRVAKFSVDYLAAPTWIQYYAAATDPTIASYKQGIWALESLTVDYIRTRYYLWASSVHYKNSPSEPTVFRPFRDYQAPWATNAWNSAALAALLSSEYQIFDSNNQGKIAYSARAGAPNVWEMWVSYGLAGDQPFYTKFKVFGAHYYWDPNSKQIVFIGTSTASDCNFGTWGIFSYPR